MCIRDSAITTNVGAIWAPDLVKHEGRYYLYFPGRTDHDRSNYVVWADDILSLIHISSAWCWC